MTKEKPFPHNLAMEAEKLYIELAEAIAEAIYEPPCMSTDPDLFFGSGEDNPYTWIQAQKMCKTCPVIKECAIYAITKPEPHGIWGGLTPNQRKAIRRGKTSPKQEMSRDLVARPHLRQIAAQTSQ